MCLTSSFITKQPAILKRWIRKCSCVLLGCVWNTVGPHGLGRRNQKGHMLIGFCERKGLAITNTWFKKPKKRLYTSKAPENQSWHQLDYILVKHKFWNSMKDVQTMPWADTNSYRNLLVVNICTRMRKILSSKEDNQDGIWRSYMLNDIKHKRL